MSVARLLSRNLPRRGRKAPKGVSDVQLLQADGQRRETACKSVAPGPSEVLEDRVTPTTFHVNSLLDTVAASLKTGKDASGHISLRSAIQAADAKPNADTIILPQGTITLTIAGAGEDNAATGDLDIRGNLTIKGKGAGATVIDGNNLDRVFQVLSGTVAISGVTIQHGLASDGGGLLNSGGKVTLTSVSVVNNLAIGSSGAAGANGVTAGSVGGEGGAGGAGGNAEGGGISNRPARSVLTRVFVASNQAIGGAGGAGGNGSFGGGSGGISGTNGRSGVGGGGGAGGSGGIGMGGGVFNAAGATLSLTAASFFSNSALGGAGGAGGFGNIGAGGAGGNDNGGVGFGGDGNGGSGGSGGNGGEWIRRGTLQCRPRELVRCHQHVHVR